MPLSSIPKEHTPVLPCLAPQTNGDAMTSTWLGKSRELYEILTGGQLHCANVSPASPRPSLHKTIHKERKGA